MTVTLKIDNAHSRLGFMVKHMMFSKVYGNFKTFSGEIQFDEEHVENSSVTVDVDVTSVDTANEQRNNHLRTADFFNAETNPVMTFRSTRVHGSADEFEVEGDLTMNGVTRPVTLKVEYSGHGMSPMGAEIYAFEAEGKLKRSDFGMEWNAAIETGGVLVSDEVKLGLEIEANPAQ